MTNEHDPIEDQKSFDPDDDPEIAANVPWRIRRRFMLMIIAFCMGVVSYVLYKELDSGVAESAVDMAFLTIMGTMGSYVFGATWSDISRVKR